MTLSFGVVINGVVDNMVCRKGAGTDMEESSYILH